MSVSWHHSISKQSGGQPGFAIFRRAAPKGALAAGIIAAGLTLAGAASADNGSIGMQWLNAPPIKVESDGSKYTKVANAAAPIQGSMIVHVEAELSGKVKSWEAEPKLGLGDHGWDSFPASGASQSYGLPRPKTVHTAFPFAIPKADYAAFMVTACNYHADELRQQGLSNSQIFGQDREYKIAVWGGLEYETTGIAGSQPPPEVESWEIYPKVTLICEGDHEELDPAKPAITSVSLVVKGSNSVEGSCELRLGGSIISKEPNVEAKFRYVDDSGKQSDVKTVTTNIGRIALFEHSYPVDAGTSKSGRIQVVGVSHAFMSTWVDYEVNCAVASQDKVSVLPPDAYHLEGIATADETMHKGFACPQKVKIYGILKGRGTASGAAALFAAGQLKTLKQYSIENGQTIIVEGEHDLNWSSVHAFGNTVPHQNVKFAMNVTNAVAAIVDQIEATQQFSCRKVSTSGVAGDAAGGLSTGTTQPLPSQQAGAGQLTLQQAPAVTIMAPRGLVRNGQIRLSGGAANATYDLTFYRKSGGGYVAYPSAQLPKQMTGLTAGFQLGALDGGRDWRIEVCPAGPAQGSCKTSNFRLPAIGAEQVQPAPGVATPMIIAPGTLK